MFHSPCTLLDCTSDIESFKDQGTATARRPPSHHGLPAVRRRFLPLRRLQSRAAALELQAEEELRAAPHQLLQLGHRGVHQTLHDGGQLRVKARGRAHPGDWQPPL